MMAANIEQRNGMSALKNVVQQKFSELRAAVHMREKLLLRQLDVIVNSQKMAGRGAPLAAQTPTSPTEDTKLLTGAGGEVRFVAEQEQELLAAIRSFGRFQLDNMNLTLQDVYLKNEDYIEPADDHETMYKCLQERSHTEITYEEDDDILLAKQPEAIVVDFSRNKSLVEDNAKLMNKSIINITLQEAKDLIRKAKLKRDTYVPPLNLEEMDDELESSIAEAVSSLGRETTKSSSAHTCLEQSANDNSSKPKSKKPRFKPKITINNCNGTINLRNIASLTINCANEEAVSAEIPLVKVSADSSTTEQSTPTNTNTASSSNYSSNASSRSQSKKHKGSKKGKYGSEPEQLQGKNVTTAVAEAGRSSSSTSAAIDADGNADDCSDSSHIVTCDFYNRLLNEIKKSLVNKPTRSCYEQSYVQAAAADSTCDANSNATAASSVYTVNSSQQGASNSQTSTTSVQPGKRLILKNFENLKIILEANSSDEDAFHPVQIEQWLAEIISETDLEPVQNTEILEHSKINSEGN